jgi:PKD repeat protein
LNALKSFDWDLSDPSHSADNSFSQGIASTAGFLYGFLKAVRIENMPLNIVADFTGSPITGFSPLTVQFTNLSSGTITGWSWNFGDGESSTEQNPSHIFQNPGIYTVSLTITASSGTDTKTLTNYIDVKPAPQSETYHLITKWGSYGTGDGQFAAPFGVAVDSSGNVYVADYFIDRIQTFDSNGNFITKWGSYGTGDGQFEYPGGVAVDSSGNVYVGDCWNHRIQKFDSNGNFITKWGSYGTGDGQFDTPGGVAVDSFGNVYVADYGNNRIQKFGRLIP